MGNATAFRRQRICPSPSSLTEKLLLIDPIHSDCWARYFASFKTASPSNETTSVSSEENKAQYRDCFSFLKKKVTNPVSRGINISKTGTIIIIGQFVYFLRKN